MSKFVLEGDVLTEAEREKLCGALSDAAQADAPLLIETVSLSAAEIRALNARTRGVDSVTDVLSFPELEGAKGAPILADEHGECVDEEGRILLGSVALCEERAREQAAEYGHSYEREKCYLVVHGILHCLGYDHEREDEKREMRAAEEKIMKRLDLGREE